MEYLPLLSPPLPSPPPPSPTPPLKMLRPSGSDAVFPWTVIFNSQSNP